MQSIHLFHDEIGAWLGHSFDGQYLNFEFTGSYKEFQDKRDSFLTHLAMNGSISRDIWRCVAWTQLHQKIEPPKEIQSSSEVTTPLQVEDFHEIMKKLEGASKKSSGI